jgi:ABC-2 type transport system permease protein
MFALFGLLALSVVVSTADHVTGAIVPTLQWTPRRGVLLAARSSVVVATATLLGVLLVAAASVVVWAFLPGIGLPLDEGLDTLGGLALVYACCALLAVGLGLTLRSTAGGLVTVIALVLVLPPLLANLPFEWAVDLSALLPGSNALFLIFGEGPRDDMTVTSSRLLLAAWGVLALLAGGWRLVRTDANR